MISKCLKLLLSVPPVNFLFGFIFFYLHIFLNFIFTVSFRLCYLFQSVYPFAHSVHSSSPYPER